MTTLYLLRHAEAQPQQTGQTDAERALTSRGSEQCRQVGGFLRSQNIAPSHFWASPYLRTQQTANFIAKELAHSHTLHAPAWLALGEDPLRVLDEIHALAEKHSEIMLISHEPNISAIITLMLGANTPAIKVRKASLTALTLDPQISAHATLLWSIPVSMMALH